MRGDDGKRALEAIRDAGHLLSEIARRSACIFYADNKQVVAFVRFPRDRLMGGRFFAACCDVDAALFDLFRVRFERRDCFSRALDGFLMPFLPWAGLLRRYAFSQIEDRDRLRPRASDEAREA